MSSVRRQNAGFSQVFTSHESSGTGAAGRGRYLRVAMAGAPRALHMHEPRTCGAMQHGPTLTGSHFINSLSSSCSFKCSIIANKAVTLCLQLYNLAKCRGDPGCEDGARSASLPGWWGTHAWVWSNHVGSAALGQPAALIPSPPVLNGEKT